MSPADGQVRSLVVPDGERPAPQVIAARLDLGSAEYHEHCCSWLLWAGDQSLFTEMPPCTCGGVEMAKAYVAMAEAIQVHRERIMSLGLGRDGHGTDWDRNLWEVLDG